MRVLGLGLVMLALTAPALAGQEKPAPPVPAPVPAPPAKPLQSAPGAVPSTAPGNTTGRNDSVPVSQRGNARPKQSYEGVLPGWYSDAMAAIDAKRPSIAIELVTPVLAEFEKQYAVEKRKIFCAVNVEQSKAYLADAARGAVEAVAVEPNWCRAQYVRGFALVDLGNLDDALKVFRALTELAPRNSRYLNELGYVLADLKKYPESIAVYQRAADAAELSPDGLITQKCLAYRGIGFSLRKMGRLSAAEEAYRTCLKVDPENEEAIKAIEGIEKDRLNTV